MGFCRQALVGAIAGGAMVGFGTAGFADGIALPEAGSSVTPGPTTQSQEVSAVEGARGADPFYEAKGIPLGGPWRLFPDLYTSIGYDDNVYRGIGVAKVSSAVYDVDPSFILQYDTSRAQVNLFAQGGYQDLDQYDLVTYNAGVQGQYEISHAARVSLNVSDGLFYEDYSSANTFAFEKRPNQYYLFDAAGKFEYKPNRLGVTVGGSYDSYAYTDTPLNVAPFNQYFGWRNANINKEWAELSYDFSPGYSAFVRGTYNQDDELTNAIYSPFNRSSNGYNVDAGVDLLLGNLAKGEVYIGYLDQSYKAPFKDVSGLDFGANITWYPTELLTLKLSGSRQIENTTLIGAGAGDDRGGSLGADYELLRRLHVLANVGYDDTNYAGSTPKREDQSFSAGGGLKFLLSHYVWLNANYTYVNRASTVASGRYVDNLATIGLNLQD
jgi:hypothetical protein